ncbi:hypothetical protein GGF37_002117 [Kickxella alabastrina]|nr:hypothetical protein GGF37_002117 [Kickxella alabastrina]
MAPPKNTDIREARPYFRFKRGFMTLFIETESKETLLSVRARLLEMLAEHGGGDSDFDGLTVDRVRLVVQEPQQEGDSTMQFRSLEDCALVGAAGLTDDQAVYFVLQGNNGEWEEPEIVDYDAVDSQEMDLGYA